MPADGSPYGRFTDIRGALIPLCLLALVFSGCAGAPRGRIQQGRPEGKSAIQTITVSCPRVRPDENRGEWYEGADTYARMELSVTDSRPRGNVGEIFASSPAWAAWLGTDLELWPDEDLGKTVEREVNAFLNRDKHGQAVWRAGGEDSPYIGLEKSEPLTLEVRIVEAMVRSIPAGVNGAGGTLKATVRLSADVRDAESGAAVLKKDFVGKESVNVTDFLKSRYEDAFNSAYCSVLSSLRKEIRKVSYGGPSYAAASKDAPIQAPDRVLGQRIHVVAEADYPDDVKAAEGLLWVTEAGDPRKPRTIGSVLRIDPESHDVVASIPAGKGPHRIAYGFGRLWVAGGYIETVLKIDPLTNKALAEIGVGAGVDDIAAGEGAVWVAGVIESRSGETLILRIDPGEERITGRVRFSPSTTFTGITVSDGSVWALDGRLTTPGRAKVYRIDPETNRVTAEIPVGEYSLSIASGEGALWVVNAGKKSASAGTVSRIDPKTNSVTATIQAGNYPFSVAVGGGYVWVSNIQDETVMKIDPRTNRVIETIRVGKAPRRLAFGEGTLWFTSGTDLTLNSISP